MEKPALHTSISEATEDKVIVRGRSLTELMGNVDFADAAFLVLNGKLPNKSESRIFNAILVSLIEHGIGTQVFAARWTIRMAPESTQGAIASAVLGIGDQFGGAAERVGQMLSEAIEQGTKSGMNTREVAKSIVEKYTKEHRNIPGLGHTIHKGGDPRAERLVEIAREEKILGNHLELIQEICETMNSKMERQLVVNVMGVIGALVLDLGMDWKLAKGLMVMSKVPGILAHIQEELRSPVTQELSKQIDSTVRYDGPLPD